MVPWLVQGSDNVETFSMTWIHDEDGKTHSECLLDRPLRSDDSDTLDVEPVLPRTCEGEPALVDVRRKLEGREEERVPLDRIVAQCSRVHSNELTLPCCLSTPMHQSSVSRNDYEGDEPRVLADTPRG